MAQARQVSLTEAQTQELCRLRDHHPRPHVRLKAAGILKVAQGHSVRWVAAHGLLKPVRRETVGNWIDRYLQEGAAGLLVQAGRGRKPVFSPCARQRGNRRSRAARGTLPQSVALRT